VHVCKSVTFFTFTFLKDCYESVPPCFSDSHRVPQPMTSTSSESHENALRNAGWRDISSSSRHTETRSFRTTRFRRDSRSRLSHSSPARVPHLRVASRAPWPPPWPRARPRRWRVPALRACGPIVARRATVVVARRGPARSPRPRTSRRWRAPPPSAPPRPPSASPRRPAPRRPTRSPRATARSTPRAPPSRRSPRASRPLTSRWTPWPPGSSRRRSRRSRRRTPRSRASPPRWPPPPPPRSSPSSPASATTMFSEKTPSSSTARRASSRPSPCPRACPLLTTSRASARTGARGLSLASEEPPLCSSDWWPGASASCPTSPPERRRLRETPKRARRRCAISSPSKVPRSSRWARRWRSAPTCSRPRT